MATDFARPEYAAPIRLIAGRSHYDEVIAAIAEARQSVWIATANLKELMIEDLRARPGRRRTLGAKRGRGQYRSILDLFEELTGRGVEVRLLHAGEPSRAFAARLAGKPGLRKTSFEMRQCPRVHFKTVVIDGRQIYLGSANFTGAGLGAKGEGRRNFEVGLVSRDDLLLDEMQSLFDEIWRGDPCAACKLRAICPAPLDGIRNPGIKNPDGQGVRAPDRRDRRTGSRAAPR